MVMKTAAIEKWRLPLDAERKFAGSTLSGVCVVRRFTTAISTDLSMQPLYDDILQHRRWLNEANSLNSTHSSHSSLNRSRVMHQRYLFGQPADDKWWKLA